MGQSKYCFRRLASIPVANSLRLGYAGDMDILAIILITALFAAIGLLIAVKLSPDRKENRDKFLMTVMVCVSLAVVVSGLVRKPVVKLIRAEKPAATAPAEAPGQTPATSQSVPPQPGETPEARPGTPSISEAIQGNALFGLVQEAAPEVGREFLRRAVTMHEKARQDGMDLSLTDWEVSVILWEKLVPGGVGIAPDAAAILFARGLSKRLHALLESDPASALALLSPRSFPKGDPAVLVLNGEFGQGVRAVVMGAYNDPVPVYDPVESTQLFNVVMQDFVAHLTATGGATPDLDRQLAIMEDPEALREEADPALAQTVAAMLDYILTRPENEQAVLIKHIFSGPE